MFSRCLASPSVAHTIDASGNGRQVIKIVSCPSFSRFGSKKRSCNVLRKCRAASLCNLQADVIVRVHAGRETLEAWRRVRDYIKYDLREIIAPTSLPYPPGEEPPGNEWKDFWKTLRLATQDYLDTWKSKKPEKEQQKEEQQEIPLSEDLVGVAKSGAESVKPILQQLYRTRATAYQEAVRSFVQGYREGFAGLPDSDDNSAVESPPASAAPDQASAPAAPMKGSNAARQDATKRPDAKDKAVLDKDGTPPESQEAAEGSMGGEVKKHHSLERHDASQNLSSAGMHGGDVQQGMPIVRTDSSNETVQVASKSMHRGED